MKHIDCCIGPLSSHIFNYRYASTSLFPQTAEQGQYDKYREEFSKVLEVAQPDAATFFGSSLITPDHRDVDMLLLVPDVDDFGAPPGYRPDLGDSGVPPDVYPLDFRSYRKGVFNLVITDDQKHFDRYRAASILMSHLAFLTPDLLSTFLKKENRVVLYNNMEPIEGMISV